MGLKLVTAPRVEPVLFSEAKTHLRVTTTDDDLIIASLVAAARQRIELWLRRSLITQTWDYSIDRFPGGTTGHVDVPRPPLQSVAAITYLDSTGATRTLAPAGYVVDAATDEIGRIAPAWGQSWPATRATLNAVTIRFVAGYGSSGSSVPQAIRQAILIEIGDLYENRESVVAGQPIALGPVAERLAWPYRALAVE